jgi:hypothetical protein
LKNISIFVRICVNDVGLIAYVHFALYIRLKKAL